MTDRHPKCTFPLTKDDATIMNLPLALSLLLIGSALLALRGAADANAQPAKTVCRGTLGRVTIDNLEVPAFASCTLNGTVVLGSIEVKPGGRLTADGISVLGNIQAREARSVIIRSSSIAGSVEIVQGGVARVLRCTVGGNIKVADQHGAVAILGNQVGGNLQCKERLPVSTGVHSTMAGTSHDPCSRA